MKPCTLFLCWMLAKGLALFYLLNISSSLVKGYNARGHISFRSTISEFSSIYKPENQSLSTRLKLTQSIYNKATGHSTYGRIVKRRTNRRETERSTYRRYGKRLTYSRKPTTAPDPLSGSGSFAPLLAIFLTLFILAAVLFLILFRKRCMAWLKKKQQRQQIDREQTEHSQEITSTLIFENVQEDGVGTIGTARNDRYLISTHLREHSDFRGIDAHSEETEARQEEQSCLIERQEATTRHLIDNPRRDRRVVRGVERRQQNSPDSNGIRLHAATQAFKDNQSPPTYSEIIHTAPPKSTRSISPASNVSPNTDRLTFETDLENNGNGRSFPSIIVTSHFGIVVEELPSYEDAMKMI